jgi:tripartite-type tricarboxylate transporter receptor subunit TctC
MKRILGLAAGAIATMLVAAPSQAQQYPTQSVRMVVPFGAGSITDNLARIISDKLGGLWKQSVVVENRPGLPGTTAVAKADKDGYTLMLTSNGHVIARTINKNVSFDPVADFVGITRVVEVPFIMILNPSIPAKSLKEFIDLVKKEPGKYNFSSAGVASTSFLMAETLRQAAGDLKLVHVPFKGVPEAVTAVLRGDVAFYMSPVPDSIEQSTAGKVRMLAVSSPQRHKSVPDLPTIVETVPSFKYETWFGIMAPAGVSKAIVDKVNADVRTVLAMPDVIERLTRIGSLPSPNSPAEFDALIKSDERKYAEVLKNAGIEAK